MHGAARFLIVVLSVAVVLAGAFLLQQQGYRGGYAAGFQEGKAAAQLASMTAQPSLLPSPTAAPEASAAPTAQGYIGNSKSMKFHLPTCRNLPSEENRVLFSRRSDALAKGYEPCGVCNP